VEDKRLKPLFDKRAGFVQERVALLDKVIGEARGLTDEERAEQERLAVEMHTMDELITLAKATVDLPRDGCPCGEPQATGEELRDFGEFLQLARFSPNDSRLQYRERPKDGEKRQLSMGVGAAGGFLVPEQFGPLLAPITPQDAVIRPRATVIPAGDPPDSAITFPALDQSGARGVHSGVAVVWIAEAHVKPETDPAFLDVKLEPHEVAAHVIISDKLLRNAPAAGALVSTILRRAIISAEDQAFLTGTGIGQPLGIVGHAATVTVARAGGVNTVTYADLVAMYSVAKFGGRLAWVASPTTLPQLLGLIDPGAGGTIMWQPNAREGAPGTLMGFPLIINERSPVLGARGDLMLVDLAYYLIKDGSPLTIAMSEHVRFTSNQTIIKAFWNVDGQPWLTTPLLLEDGVSLVSPFVELL